MEYNIENKILNYVVPFKYDGEYLDFISKMKEMNYEDYKAQNIKNDLYDSIKNDLKGNNAICKILTKKEVLPLIYFSKVGKDESVPIDVYVKNFKLYIYKGNIAFFTYNIESTQLNNDDTLISFQSICKDLCFSKSGFLLKRQDENNNIFYNPFYLGVWIAKQFDGISISFLPSVNNPYIELCNKKDEEKYRKTLRIYNNDYVVKFNDDYKLPNDTPDKAICFSYINFKKDFEFQNDFKDDFAFHIAKGYNSNYKFTPGYDFGYHIAHPFENVTWCTSNEGSTYVNYPPYENDIFNKENLPPRIEEIYFYLFIRSLYIKYSLLKFSCYISNEFPSEINKYSTSEIQNKISLLQTSITIFRNKVMAYDVSYITHINEFYNLVNKAFNNDENSVILLKNLNDLNAIQKQNDTNKLNFFLTTISLIQMTLALPQLFSLIILLFSLDNVKNIIQLYSTAKTAFVVFIVSTALLAFLFVVVIIYALKSRKTKYDIK